MTWRSLICEEHSVDGTLQGFVSIGRVSFWILLAYMSYFWLTLQVVPDTLYMSWIAVLIYNLSKKLFTFLYEKVNVTFSK
jgi:hypothetical protein